MQQQLGAFAAAATPMAAAATGCNINRGALCSRFVCTAAAAAGGRQLAAAAAARTAAAAP